MGGNQQGLNAFVSNYLNQLLTFGTAIGEIILGSDGIYALYNSELENIELKRSKTELMLIFTASTVKYKIRSWCCIPF